MSYDIQTYQVLQFSQNVEFLLQQRGMKLPGFVNQGSYTGKAGSVVDQVGTIGIVRDRARLTDTPQLNVPSDRRWVYPHSLTSSTLIDNLDVIRMLIDLKSPYAQAISEALGRAVDDEIGAAFFAAAMTGEQGLTTTAFPAAQQIGVNVGGTNSGLNVPKLRAAKRLLMQSGIDLAREQPHVAITAVEHDNLLGELQVTNLDYNSQPTLVEGRVTSFLGFTFHQVEWQATMTDGVTAQYPLSLAYIAPGGLASTTRYIPVWVQSGMHLGRWGATESRVSERPDKNYNIQVWSELNCGAVRTQEKKVVQIACLST